MKDKIMLFVIGVLVGAVIATGAFFAYTKINSSNNSGMTGPGGNPPSMPSGQNGENNGPPEMPNGNNSQNSTQTNNETSSNE